MQYIPLTKGQFAIIDDEDYERINQWKWYSQKSNTGYYAARSMGRDKSRFMHYEVLNLAIGKDRKWVVDHINRNPLDNRKENLRICSTQQNLFNSGPKKKKGKTSYYKGIMFHQGHKRWAALLCYKRKQFHLGYFQTEYEAMTAYNLAVVKKMGDYAYVNRWRGPTLPPPAGAEKSLQRYYAEREFSPPGRRRKPKIDPKRLPPGIQLCFDFYYEEEESWKRMKHEG